MLAPRWRKVLRDLWSSKARTLLVVLSIAIGVAAIGMVAGTYAIITRDLPASYAQVNPASATISTSAFDDGLVRVVSNLPGVRDVEGRSSLQVRLQTGPNQWRDLQLYVIPDFNNIRINKIWPESGTWPPGESEILIERTSLALTRAQVGGSLLVETPEGKQRTLKLVGLVHDLNHPSGAFTNQASGYITFDTLAWLGYPQDYNEMLITVNGNQPSLEYVRQVTTQVEDKIEKSGRSIYWTTIPQPGKHWFEPYLTPMASILGVLGFVILLLSSFLVINTITALLAQQARQIGVMKAVGARTAQIMAMYLVSVLIIGTLALAIAIPLGSWGTKTTVRMLAGFINFNVQSFELPPQVIELQILLSLLIPLLSSLFPILASARITVREAISDYGLSQLSYGANRMDRWLGRVRGLSRPFMLSLRNTFRRKARLLLTLVTLTLGSAIFIAVFSTYASLIRTLDDALQYYGFDVAVSFNHPYRIEQIMNEVSLVPGVVTAETWGVTNSRIVHSDTSESNNILLVAPPTDTQLIHPNLIQGRWLLPEDANAIVINTDVLREDPGIQVGDKVDLKIEGNTRNWTVVGIVRSVLIGPWAYTNYTSFSQVLGRSGLASAVYVASAQHNAASQAKLAKALEDHFDSAGLRVSSTGIVSELRSTAVSQFNVIVVFLLVMAVTLTLVGGLGLMGTMSLNVLERTREIGVLRAIGASDLAVMKIVVMEGILIGVVSWLFGVFLAVPLSTLLSNAVGNGFLQVPLSNIFSFQGALLWLGAMVILSVLASLLPANHAIRLTVRDVLAYE